MTTPLTPEQLAIIADYQTLSQALAGPTPTGAPVRPIPTRPQPTITDVQPPQEAPGNDVIITGTNLGGTTSVSVGTTRATLGPVTATDVTFKPTTAMAGTTARITVTTDLGWVISPTDFTVTS
jgi:hypothetical protein